MKSENICNSKMSNKFRVRLEINYRIQYFKYFNSVYFNYSIQKYFPKFNIEAKILFNLITSIISLFYCSRGFFYRSGFFIFAPANGTKFMWKHEHEIHITPQLRVKKSYADLLNIPYSGGHISKSVLLEILLFLKKIKITNHCMVNPKHLEKYCRSFSQYICFNRI